MNDERHETDSVEVLLQRFRAVNVPEELMERLRAARPVLSPVPAPVRAERRKVLQFPFLPHAGAVAAALVAGFITWHVMQPDAAPQDRPAVANHTEAQPDLADMEPQQSTQRLMDVRDIGIARDEFRRPVRLMHATWVDDDFYPRAAGAQPVREARVREEIVPVVLSDF